MSDSYPVDARIKTQRLRAEEREQRANRDLRRLLADAFSSVEFVPFSMTVDKILDEHGYDRPKGEPWSWWIAGAIVRGLDS